MDSQYQQQYDTINSATRIAGLLSAYENTPYQLRLAIGNQHDMHTSAILLIDPNRKFIIISRLLDADAHDLVQQKIPLRVYYHVNGADISFATRLLKQRTHNGQQHYAIAFPADIKYRQRRAAYRVHVSLSLEVTASFKDQQGRTHIGQLRDISASGMKVQFTRVQASTFEQQAVVPNCTISLPDDTDIKCTFRVRHLQENNRKNGFTIGGNFVALEHDDKRTIERFIASLERKTLREFRN